MRLSLAYNVHHHDTGDVQMVKTERLAIRITEELKDRLAGLAMENHSDSLSQEARRILEKSLGIKRTKPKTN